MEGKADTPLTEENKSSTYETVQEHAQRSIALRTVPFILKHGERCLQVNCFLDEGSDVSYVNEDVVEEPAGTKRRSQVTGHRAQVTGHRSQGTGHRAQGTGHRAQGTGHRAQKTQ